MNRQKIPHGWISTTLDEIAIWSSGGTPSRSKPDFFKGTIPWIKTGELGHKVITKAEEHISEEAIASSSAKIFPRGAVVLAMYGATIGKVSILGINAATNQACAVGIPDAVSSEFLYYFLLSQTQNFIDAGKGGAQPNISQTIVKKWPIELPPLKEQFRIVAKLEELLPALDAGVSELQAAQDKLVHYRQSLLKSAINGTLTAEWRSLHNVEETGQELLTRLLENHRLSWEEKTLSVFRENKKTPPPNWRIKYRPPTKKCDNDLPLLPKNWVWAGVEQLGEVQLGRQRSPEKLKGLNPTPYIRAANITEAGINLTNVLEMDFSESERKTFALKNDDILLTEASGSPEHVGRPAIWKNNNDLYCFQNTVIRFSPIGISSKFAFYSFLAMQKLGIFRKESSGVGINHLSAGKFAKLPMALPPTSEQLALVQILEHSLAEYDRHLQAILLSIKQSSIQRRNILHAALTGQLISQDPGDEPAEILIERIRSKRRAELGKPKSVKQRANKEDPPMKKNLIEVLRDANGWMTSQEIFHCCGVVDDAQTETIELIYSQLRELDKAGQLVVEPVMDSQGRKIYDKLKLAET